MDCAAFEFNNLFRHEADPSFAVAVDGVLVTFRFQSVRGGRACSSNQTVVFIFSVDDAQRAVLFDELEGEKLTLCFFDECVNFFGGLFVDLHLLFFFVLFVFFDEKVNRREEGAESEGDDNWEEHDGGGNKEVVCHGQSVVCELIFRKNFLHKKHLFFRDFVKIFVDKSELL